MDLWTLKATLELDNTDYLEKVEAAKKDAEEIGKSWDSNKPAASAPDTGGKGTGASGVTGGMLVYDLIQDTIDMTKELAVESIQLASSMDEVQNVVDTTFGSSALVIDSWAKTTSESFGISEFNAKQFSGTLGAMFKSMGFTSEEAMGMSIRMTELAGDMASFYNIDHETAFRKIRSGISGEIEPLKQLGINMSVANMEAYAMSQGIEVAWKDMTEAEKAAVRYSALLAQTADAQGDFARTSDNFANSSRQLENNINTAKTYIGSALLPIAEGFTNTLNSAFATLNTQSFTDQLVAIENTTKTSREEVEYTAERAQNMISVLAGFGPATQRSAAEQAQWIALVGELTRQFPELGSVINTTTGEIDGGTEALSEHVKAWEEAANVTIDESRYNAIERSGIDFEAQLEKEKAALANARSLMQIAGADAQVIGSQVAAELGKTFDGTNESFIEMMSTVEGYQTALKLGFTDLDITEATTPYYEQVEEAEQSIEKIAALEEDIEAAKAALATTEAEMIASSDSLAIAVDTAMTDVKTDTDEAVDNFDQSAEARANAKATGDGVTAGLAAARPSFLAEVGRWISSLAGLGRSANEVTSRSTVDGSHAVGLDYVPYNNYVANLHQGEAVLTRSEAEDWRSGKSSRPNITVIQNIYSEAKTAAELMEEARWAQERAVLGYV